jgi:peptidoglycan/xylan/chitin deacetylase (PgdA/CDA1 family)
MSKFRMALSSTVLLIVCSADSFANEHLVALTIDDLPFVGTNSSEKGNLGRTTTRFNKLVDSIVERQVPATGFIIAGSIAKGQWELLEYFKQQGFSLGNHTYSHINLNQVGAERYIQDLDKADQKLAPIMTTPKYFRYPYLAEGRGEDKNKVYDYLSSHQYTIAPVTIDSKDYRFNERLLRVNWRNRADRLPALKKEYLNFIDSQITKAEKMNRNEKPEILLVHANLINSYAMGDVIDIFKNRGYRFITLEEALSRRNNSTTQ